MNLNRICDWIIEYTFYLLFFLVPLIMTPLNYELFEYNKMMLTYGLTTIITGAWIIKMVLQKKFIFKSTPFDIPVILFLISQVLSTIFSIDRHVSLWGYYSRFHGGLLSTISYTLLFYAIASNLNLKKIINILKVSFSSALLVSLYGILEHFGIDKSIWVQDVQNRVFSTIGQPNWLAAYIVILIPIVLGFILSLYKKESERVNNFKFSIFNFQSILKFPNFIYYGLLMVLFLCLLYTKSRSGIGALAASLGFFWLGFLFLNKKAIKSIINPFIIFGILFLCMGLWVGTPYSPRIVDLINKPTPSSTAAKPVQPTGPALETGGTESFTIRKIVWQGAWEVALHYPIFGSGVETFAFSYFQYRPQAHNMVSEWDFLYNKAHNEYLNFAATTGFVGLGIYLLLIGWFLVWIIYKIYKGANNQKENTILLLAILSAYLSILITNFVGFSVVIVALYFYLFPAMSFTLENELIEQPRNEKFHPLSTGQKISTIIILITIGYILFTLGKIWYADTYFNKGYQYSRAGHYQEAYQFFTQAINLNPSEPYYRDEISYPAASLAIVALSQKDGALANQLINEAITQNRIALTTCPSNVNFWKTRTKIYYALSSVEGLPKEYIDDYNKEALDSLIYAQKLAPTDPRITYNLALIYGKMGDNQTAVKTLEDTIKLKPDYREARFALALYLDQINKRDEAITQLKYLLKNIASDDGPSLQKLKEWNVTYP